MGETKAWDNIGFKSAPPIVSSELRQIDDINSTKTAENKLYGSGKPYRQVIKADLRKNDTSDTNE